MFLQSLLLPEIIRDEQIFLWEATLPKAAATTTTTTNACITYLQGRPLYPPARFIDFYGLHLVVLVTGRW